MTSVTRRPLAERLGRPHPALIASVLGSCALTLVYAARPIPMSTNGAPNGGIVSWSTVGSVNPYEDYAWYALCLAAAIAAALAVFHLYAARIAELGEPDPFRPAGTNTESARSYRAARLVTLIVLVGWAVRAIAYDPTSPIRDLVDLQPTLPAGLRFDPFHDGERLGFLPTVLASGRPFVDTFFIHGFGMDVAPALLAHALLSNVDIVIGTRIVLVGQLIITFGATVLVLREIARSTRVNVGNRIVFLVGIVAYALLVRTVYPHLALSLVQLALVIRSIRLVREGARAGVILMTGATLGMTLPLGLVYSYTGLVASAIVTGVTVVLLLVVAHRRALTWMAGLGTAAITSSVLLAILLGTEQLGSLIEQVVYWARWGPAIWNRPPNPDSGPHDLVMPALLMALLMQTLVIVWIAWTWWRRESVRTWLGRSALAWVLLAYAAFGARDALDRGGYDYGERAIVAAGFGAAFLAMTLLKDRGARLAATPAMLRVLLVLATLTISLQATISVASIATTAHDVEILPPAFRDVPAAVQLRTPASDCIYSMTSEGLWYLAFDRPSCSRFHQLNYARTEEAQTEVVHDLMARMPEVIVFSNEGNLQVLDGLTDSSTNAIVVRWVLRHYAPLTLLDGAWIWSPRSDPPALAPATGSAPATDQVTVQRGTEATISGDLPPGSGRQDCAVYVTIDGEPWPVAAAPIIERSDAAHWTVRVPTFDRAPGGHVVGAWLGCSPSDRLQLVASNQLRVEPRAERLRLDGT